MESKIFDARVCNESYGDHYDYEYWWNVYSPTEGIDASYDIFTIDIPGYNSPFLLKKTNEVWQAAIPDSPLKITPLFSVYNELTGFSVVDEKGITYLFGGQYMEKHPIVGYSTAWMLYQIILPGGTPNQISITWDKYIATCNAENMDREAHVLYEYYYELIQLPRVDGPIFMAGHSLPYPDYNHQTVFIPKQIAMPSQTMDFTYVAYGERPYITGFTVKNKLNKVVKSVGMDYINPATYTNYSSF